MAYPGPKQPSATSAFAHSAGEKRLTIRQAMGGRSRCRVLETMTWDRVIDRLEEIYVGTIDHKRPKREGSEALATMRTPGGRGLRLGARRNDVSAD